MHAVRKARSALADLSALFLVSALALALTPRSVSAVTIDFEDVGVGLAPESFYNGSDGAGGFSSGGGSFPNTFTDFGGGCCWEGWAYSKVSDATTPGFGNQYGSLAGSGAGGSATFGVSFGPNSLTLPGPATVSGAWLGNTTYAGLSMLLGDGFAKQFGGPSGDDPDFFKLTIDGRDALGALTASVDLYLADYRFADNSQDFVLDEWAFVDLTPLGVVSSLEFSLESSDVGPFGMNTPAYFALDDLSWAPALPEARLPLASALLLGSLAWRRRAARA